MEKTNAVDRHVRELVTAGLLKKVAQGMNYLPKQSSFGPLPYNHKRHGVFKPGNRQFDF